MRRIGHYANRTVKSLLLPVVVYLFFTLVSRFRFGSLNTLSAIARQAVQSIVFAYAIYGNMALGMWDFSAGANLVLSAIIGGQMTLALGTGLFGLLLFSILTAVILNLITMLVQHLLQLPSIIVTLGLSMIYETASALVFEGKGVNLLPIRSETVLGKSPYCFIVLAVCALAFYIAHNHTLFGYRVRSLGQGGGLSRSIGVPELRTKVAAAIFGGVLLGVAAVIMSCQQNSAAPKTGLSSVSLVFDVIMGVLIGSYLTKYCDVTFAVAIGVFTMKMLGSGLLSLGLSATLQNVATGIFMLVFIGIASNQDKVANRRVIREKARAAEAKKTQSKMGGFVS